MGAYSYQALDKRGRNTSGMTEGDSPRQVREWLRNQGLTPLEVHEAGERSGTGRGPKLSVLERSVVLRQMATLLAAGLPLEEVLATVAQQSERQATRHLMTAIRAKVREGQDLAQAMQAFPSAFPVDITAAVSAGELSGALPEVFSRLADFSERRESVGRELWLAMLYPIIVVIVALLVVTALMVWVVPKVVQVFDHMDGELPWLTQSLIGISDVIANHGAWLLPVMVGLVVLLVWSFTHSSLRSRWQSLMLKMPVLGRALRASATARFCRSLGLQVISSVPLVDALKVASRAPGIAAMETALLDMADQVREGASLGSVLEESRLFPPLALRLIASGEQSGRLGEMLERAADAQEREAASLVSTFTGVLQPIMILLVGLLVLMIVLAIMLPILNINQLLT